MILASLIISLLPYVSSGAGQALDGWTTVVALNRGCVEGNSLGYGSQPSVSRLVVVKTTSLVLTWAATYTLQKSGHPKVAAVLGHTAGATGAGFGIHNMMLRCGR